MKSRYESFSESLKESPPESEKEVYALYGYFVGYYENGKLTVEELHKLRDQLGLTVDDVDELGIG